MARLVFWLRRYIVLILVAACSVAITPAASAAADSSSLEYQIKAALLLKFALYVDWPHAAFPTPASPLNVCVAGEDPFGSVLDSTASNQRIGERPVQIRRLKTFSRDAGCHILYVGASDAQRSAQAVDAARGAGVLTVTDSGTGGGAGIIDFVIKDNKVRFDINDEAAAQNGLTISSKLLSLAVNVKPRHKEVH